MDLKGKIREEMLNYERNMTPYCAVHMQSRPELLINRLRRLLEDDDREQSHANPVGGREGTATE